MSRRLTPADVFAFESVSDARISPDGRTVLATLTKRDLATDTRIPRLIRSQDRGPWLEVPETQGVITTRLAPDGSRIALLRRTGSRYDLIVHDGTPTILHSSTTPLRELAWSPDGTTLAFQQRIDTPLPAWLGLLTPPEGASWAPPPKHTNRRLYRHDAIGELPEAVFHLFTVPADASAPPRQITSGPWHNGVPHHFPPGLVFSADGTELLIAGTQREDWDLAPSDTDLHAIRLADGAVRRLTNIPGPTAHGTPSPDGKWIAFTAIIDRGLSHQLRRLHLIPATGGPPRELLPEFDRSIAEIAWDSAALIVTYGDAGCTHIARVTLDGAMTILARDAGAGSIEMPYGGTTPISTAADGTIAYVRTATTVPSEVALITPNGDTTDLTSLNRPLATAIGGFRPAEHLAFAGTEGRNVEAWLMRPDSPGPHPLALEIHGGPYAQYGARFSIKYQALAAAGYAVLSVNPTGSTGYGEDFANALHDRFPGPDYDDLMLAVDAALATGGIDADNLFITGVSGGGVLTLWTVTHTHRFRAAVSIKPVVDWQSWLLSGDIGLSIGMVWMGHETPWDAHEKYRARSPLSFAQDAKTPTLLMCGEADSRTPASEALQMYGAFKLAGVESELMRFPGTSHSSSVMRPSLFAAEISATIGWFDRHRK
jgi:dipeptidyl aminopeptidase/acylaminoacyl peptidase